MSRRRHVSVGQDFEGEIKLLESKTNDAVKRTEAKVKASAEKVRSWIALFIIFGGGTLLVGAILFGLYKDSFVELQRLWNVQGPMLGAIVTYYFGTGPKNDRGDGKARKLGAKR